MLETKISNNPTTDHERKVCLNIFNWNATLKHFFIEVIVFHFDAQGNKIETGLLAARTISLVVNNAERVNEFGQDIQEGGIGKYDFYFNALLERKAHFFDLLIAGIKSTDNGKYD